MRYPLNSIRFWCHVVLVWGVGTAVMLLFGDSPMWGTLLGMAAGILTAKRTLPIFWHPPQEK
jgi:hypothetical protein